MRRGVKKSTAVALVGIMSAAMLAGGCAKKNDNKKDDEKVILRYATSAVGTSPNTECEKKLIERFNQMYGDEIELVVEELPSDTAYLDKMKVLAATNELPDVVYSINGVLDLAVKNGQAMELTEVLEADPEFKEQIGEDAIEAVRQPDGGIYSVADANTQIGYFYNKDMFDKCKIKPAETWDEFMENCKILKENGFIPISLSTGENCWTANLVLAAMIGTDGESGKKFMNTVYPDSYQNESVVKGLTMMQTLLKEYTTEDALGGGYPVASNSFCQEKTAMIANGMWATADFSNPEVAVDGLMDRIGVAAFPNQSLISNYELGYSVCAKTEEPKDAAIKFLKCIADGEAQKMRMEMTGVVPLTTNIEMTEEFKQEQPLFASLMEIKKDVKVEYKTIDSTALPSVVNAMSKYYPEMAYGNITPQEMTVKMDEAIKEAE